MGKMSRVLEGRGVEGISEMAQEANKKSGRDPERDARVFRPFDRHRAARPVDGRLSPLGADQYGP